MRSKSLLASVLGCLVGSGCSGGAPLQLDAAVAGDAARPGAPDAWSAAQDAGASRLDAASPPADDAAAASDDAALPARDVRCGDPAPPGASLPPPLPAYSAGSCPAIAAGRNAFTSGGVTREFLVVVPTDYDPAVERLPVVFMWHYLGGSADSMLTHGQAQESADALRFIAVIPEKLGDLAIELPLVGTFDPAWPYLESASDARVQQELTFFDDMLACVAGAFAIDESCISTVGVSAGALWTSQLLQHRSERLASAIVMSGGIGPATSGLGAGLGLEVRGFTGVTHRMPILLGWGGPRDQCGLAFQRASLNLESHLEGHFVEECVHNCGHTVPPVDAAAGLSVLWSFALDHPYWLRDGESPYLARGRPSGTPDWCGLGVGSATPRVGECMPIEGAGGLSSCPVPAL